MHAKLPKAVILRSGATKDLHFCLESFGVMMASRNRVISVNVGVPREIHYNGRRIRTCIFKEPVSGPVAVHTLHLEGDRQADHRVHGGPDKAIYVYPAEHYDYWRAEFPDKPCPFGWFGENLTTEGLLETSIYIGDRLRIGTAEFQVTTPRVPCFKLEAKFERDDMIKRFLASRRSGFYFRVLQEGELTAGSQIEVIGRDPARIPVSEIARLQASGDDDLEGLRRAAESPALIESWRATFRERIKRFASPG
jgi:MOSC domain-containing protein YiiM